MGEVKLRRRYKSDFNNFLKTRKIKLNYCIVYEYYVLTRKILIYIYQFGYSVLISN